MDPLAARLKQVHALRAAQARDDAATTHGKSVSGVERRKHLPVHDKSQTTHGARRPPRPHVDAAHVDSRFDRLEERMEGLGRSRRRWRMGFWSAFAAVLVTSGAAFAAFSVDQDSFEGVQGNTITYDESKFSLTVVGHLVSLGESASGASFGDAQEISSTLGAEANDGPGVGDWVYVVKVAEKADGSIPTQSTTAYKAELLLDGTSQGSLYFQQGTQEDTVIEGIELRWDIGASLPASTSYLVRITEVSS